MTTRRAWLSGFVAILSVAALAAWPPASGQATLPDRLSSAEFWRLSTTLSETGGDFHSENFVSNEAEFQTVIPDLVKRVSPGGVYLGVGPEQNYSYIAATEPAMAFIVDLRRGNLHEHLLYKALFGLAADRADFVARLFSQARPAGVGRASTVDELFAALGASSGSAERYEKNIADVNDWLTSQVGLPLSADDLAGIDHVYRTAFLTEGPRLNYRLIGSGFGRGGTPTYAHLMTTDDGTGRQRSYLATEELFDVVKNLHARNLIVPVVGNFEGATALRGIGRYVRERGGVVSAFYLSNVEQYGAPVGQWDSFCANVRSMPLDRTSTFIRSFRGGRRGDTGAGFVHFRSSLGNMLEETQTCLPAVAGRP